MEDSSGIRSRWHAPEDWATSDVALPAARQALERAGLEPDDVDLIILGTDSPDYITPATSVVLQHKLGAKRAGTFDVGCACASFPTGLAAAAGMIATNPSMKAVLVVGVYLMHKLADPTTRRPSSTVTARARHCWSSGPAGFASAYRPTAPSQALGHLLRGPRAGDRSRSGRTGADREVPAG
jgi:3-oxoacyl-[acyl-carrier-protein] synthase III